MQIAALERRLAAQAELLDEVQVVDHRAIVAFGPAILISEDLRCRARKAGEEQQQIVFERIASVIVDSERLRVDRTVRRNVKQVMPPKAAMY